MSDWEQIDSGDWEQIPQDQPQGAGGFLDALAGVGKKAGAGVLEALAGFQLFGADRNASLPSSSFEKQLDPFALAKAGIVQEIGNTRPEALRQDAQALKDIAQGFNSEVDQKLQGTIYQRPVDVIGNMAVPAAASFISPFLGAASIGLQSSGQKYSSLDPATDSQGRPISPLRKALDAGLTGLVTGGLSYIPLRALGTSTGNFATRLAKETGKLGAFNAALTPPQVLGNAFIDSRVAGITSTPAQLKEQMGRGITDAFIGSVPFGAAGALRGIRPGTSALADGQVKVDPIEAQFEAQAAFKAAQEPTIPEVLPLEAPRGFQQGAGFLFKDPALPPAIRPDTSLIVTPQGREQIQGFSLTDSSRYSVLPEPAPQGFVNGPDFMMKLGADQVQMAPAAPPAIINNPVRDLTIPEPPLLDPSMLANGPVVPVQNAPLVQGVQGYSSTRSPQQQAAYSKIRKEVESSIGQTPLLDPVTTQQIIASSNRNARPFDETPIIKVKANTESFPEPSDMLAKAAQEAKQKEQPLIVSPDDSPLTVTDVMRNVINYIVSPKPSERGAINRELLGLGRGDKEVQQQLKVDPVYDKYSKRGPVAARNWMALDSIGKDVPQVKPLTEAIIKQVEDNSSFLTSIKPELMDLMRVQGDSKVNGILWKAEEKGGQLRLDSESLQGLDLTEAQTKGILASKGLQLKASEMLRSHSSEIANREYNYKVKKYQIEAPLKKQSIERQYNTDLITLRETSLDPTALREQEVALEMQRNAALEQVDKSLADSINRAAQERVNALQYTEQRRAQWDDTNYIPRNRYGKYKMRVYGKDGEVFDDRQTDSVKEVTQWKKAYESQGFRVELETLKQRAATEHFNGISDEVASSVDPVGGFKKHLMRSRRVPGADTDPVRAWAEYFQGLSKKMSIDRMEMAFKEEMLNLPRDSRDPSQVDINLSPVVNEIQKRKDSILSSKGRGWALVSKMTDLNNLAFQLRAPVSNLFAIPQRQYPELGKYVKNPAAVISKGFAVNLNRMRMSDAQFAKAYPDIAKGIELAANKRVISPMAVGDNSWTRTSQSFDKQVSRLANNTNKAIATADDVAFFLQFHSDRFAEANGFISGWLAYPEAAAKLRKQGAEAPTRQAFAEQFALDTKANVNSNLLPSAFQGMARSTFLKYKAWQLRYLGALLDAAKKGDKAYIARSLGATVASAGIRGIPFYKTVVFALTALGYNPEDQLQQYMKESGIEDRVQEATGISPTAMAVYGPPTAILGTNISGSVGFGDPLPDTSRGLEASIGNTLGGPIVSMMRKAVDFPGYVKRGQYDRAIENLPVSVPLVTNLAKAYRMSKEGVVTKNGIGILPKSEVSNKMLVEQMLGVGDIKTARAYDKYLAGERVGAEAKDATGYPAMIAEAYARGDIQRGVDLTIEAARQGVKISNKDIQLRIAKRQGNDAAIVKKFPKAVRDDVQAARDLFK